MKLIIAEKKELAEDIAIALDIKYKKFNNYFETQDYSIVWSNGHILRLKEPQEIDEKYKEWNFEDLPLFFPKWEKSVIEEKKFIFNNIKNFLAKADEVIHAGDPDDEGQYLIDEILEFCNFKKPVKRVLINDGNSEAVKKAFTKLEDNIKYIPLGKAPIKGFSEAKVTSYLYYSEDQKEKLEVSSEGITYINEKPYEGWDTFKEKVLKYISVYADILNNITIKRTSIRFINRFELAEFDDPSVYFNTAISSINGDESLPYSLQKYGFKMIFDIKEGINAVVNQNVDKHTDCYIYIFDIDVLDWNNLIYNAESFVKILENLRYIKNKIFFSNITGKIIELCN